MRLMEFASAEEQIALFRLITDNIWTALAQQQKQQAAEKAQKARQAKPRKKAAVRPRLTPAIPHPPQPIQQRTQQTNPVPQAPPKTAAMKPGNPKPNPSIAPAGPQSPRFNQPILN